MRTKSFTPLEKIYSLKKNSLTGFTLLEILITVIIIGVLATLGFINYGLIREGALNKEAKANLKLIVAAGKVYKLENDFYYPYNGSANITGINQFLKLVLPTETANWNYSVPDAQIGTGTATRSGRTWTLSVTDADGEPECSGTGCPP